MLEPKDGRSSVLRDGFSYLPQFITKDESSTLIDYFAGLQPLWETRHTKGHAERDGSQVRRLTRPVYWLGAWQFACLGYYAEPHYQEHRCLRAQAFPQVMHDILERTRSALRARHNHPGEAVCDDPANTCLINYYGREVGKGVPVDYARLRMHRDGEPGPIVMFNIGQAGLLEFLDPDRSREPELGVWARHRSVTIISGPEFKQRLYHRVSRVRTGHSPVMGTQLEDFELRRISVSFRHVPSRLIEDYRDMPTDTRAQIDGYVQELAQHVPHFRQQLDECPSLVRA